MVACAARVESGRRPVLMPAVAAVSGGTVGERWREIDAFTLAAAQRGDRAAFDAIVDLYDERLRLLAFHLLRDADLADDALQDVFFNAYRGLPAFHRRAALGTWLYRITYTVCMGYLRRAGTASVSYEGAEEVIGTDDDPAEAYVTHSQLASALACLSPEQRVVVLLVDRDGFDYRSVAEVLDVPKGTVCSRLVAARTALRAALTEAQTLPGTQSSSPSSPATGERA